MIWKKNRLSGKIPKWIGGSLPNLIVLNLRSNRFNGGTCPDLCQLKNIQILDLFSNNISGVIPRCLCSFTAMTKKGSLVIAHNYSLDIGSLAIAHNYSLDIGSLAIAINYSLEHFFVKQSHNPYYRGPYMLANFSYFDRALVKWK